MKMRYSLLYNSGKVEEFMQNGTEEELSKVHEIIYESFAKGMNAIVTFGEGGSARFVRVSDLSQFKMEIIKGEVKEEVL